MLSKYIITLFVSEIARWWHHKRTWNPKPRRIS